MTAMRRQPAQSITPGARPAVILVCGCLIGHHRLRPALGVRLLPDADASANGWGRDVFALALALQMLLWGAGAAVRRRDRRPLRRDPGAVRGALLYAAGVCADGLFDHAAGSSTSRGRADRLRPRRLLVHARASAHSASCCRRAGARSVSAPAPRPARSASSCSRRSRVGLIDKVGWQQHAADFRRDRAADLAAVACARDAPQTRRAGAPARATSADRDAGARRGVRPRATCCW